MPHSQTQNSKLKTQNCIMGIDPGLERTGWACLDSSTSKPKVLASGLIKTMVGLSIELRLQSLYDQLRQILTKYHPTKTVVEELFFTTNVKTAMQVGQARGVIMLALSEHGQPIVTVTPTQLKAALTGHGNAKKEQIQKMLPLLCEMTQPEIQDDIADALALAWYGCK